MSWDADLTCSTCGDCGPRSWNYTHNTSRMIYDVWHRFGRQRAVDERTRREVPWWAELNGLTGAESVPFLAQIIVGLSGDPVRYDAMNPENGWGSRAGLVDVLSHMRDTAQDNPTMTWEAYG